jgi:hypothetical protein
LSSLLSIPGSLLSILGFFDLPDGLTLFLTDRHLIFKDTFVIAMKIARTTPLGRSDTCEERKWGA